VTAKWQHVALIWLSGILLRILKGLKIGARQRFCGVSTTRSETRSLSLFTAIFISDMKDPLKILGP